jgi:hypothetical protein
MDVLGYNYPQIASAYSTFAGVLAGFVFAVIGYLLGSQGSRSDEAQERAQEGGQEGKFESALSWAVLAFIGLSVSCFLYGVISGEDRFAAGSTAPSIRPLYLSIFGSAVFTSSLVILLVSLMWLFYGEQAARSVMPQLRVAVYFTSFVTMLYLSGLFSAISKVQTQSFDEGPTPWALMLLVCAMAIIIGESAGGLLRRAPWGVRRWMRLITQLILLAMMFTSAGLLHTFSFGAQEGDQEVFQAVLGYQPAALVALGVVIFLCVLNLPGKAPKRPQSAVDNKPPRR